MSPSARKRADYPLYQRAVRAYLAGDAGEFLKLRRNPGLSQDEKRLLHARALFRKGEWAAARAELERATMLDGSFLGADRSFLKATTYFQEGDFEASASCNLDALKAYEALGDRRGRFLSAHNLMVDFSRMGQLKLSHACLGQAQAAAAGVEEELLLLRAQVCEASRHRRYAEALACLEKLLGRERSMTAHDREVSLNVAADVYFRAGRLDTAADALDRLLEGARGSHDRGRLSFEKALLEFHRSGAPMGPVPQAVKRCLEYALKWDLVRALQSGEQERSRELWSKLEKALPKIFGDDFACLDPSEAESAFFAAVRKLRAPAAPLRESVSGKVEVLRRVLVEARSPIRKEELIERIWGVRYAPSWDHRLYKLIERGKRSSLPIVSSQRAYSLAGS